MEQSRDIAEHVASLWVGQVGEDGHIREQGQTSPSKDLQPGMVAHALALCATIGRPGVPKTHLVDAAARCIAGQFFHHCRPECLTGCAHGALALMILGVNVARNDGWAQFPESIRKIIGQWLREESSSVPLALQPYEIVRATVAFGMGFTSSNYSEKLITDYFKELLSSPSAGFLDTAEPGSTAGRFDASGLLQLLLIRETLQRHINNDVRERRLSALRTCMMRYLRVIPFLLQEDGSGWAYGEPVGSLGTVGICSAIVCALSDGWLDNDQREHYV
ncbi:MAG: hypothetical protein LBH53_00705, partial [Puniceicoccales bacterium]|nr:hypothetical protein [Puniceicoccales bacterium]